MEIHALREMYAGHSCFLVCDGPSFKEVDLQLLATPGVITMGVNNAPATFRTDLWVFADSPDKFLDSMKEDPCVLKFVRRSHQGHVKPPLVALDLNTDFEPENYLAESSVSFGRKGESGGVRSILLVALKTLFLLGFRNVYLLGVDFKMEEGAANYHFEQETSDSHVRGNNRAYEVLAQRLDALRPSFEAAGFKVWNCNPESELKVFPFIGLDAAITEATQNMPDPASESSAGMYDRRAQEPPRIQRRAIRTIRGDKLKVVCVLKSGGDYDADDVRNLKRQVADNLTVDYEFVCFSDVPEVADRPLRCGFPGWWSKIEIFKETGPCIFFDLDTYIPGSLDTLARWALSSPRRFAMIDKWKREQRAGVWCSGVMAWSGDYSYLLKEFHARFDMEKFKVEGDQWYISRQLQGRSEHVDRVNEITPLYSYKWDCKSGVPDDAAIVCFHGKPRPRQVGAPFWIGPPVSKAIAASIFTEIYEGQKWRYEETLSGMGSTRSAAKNVSAAVPGLMRKLEASSLLDLPCGDFNWMQHVDLSGIAYYGADIVPDLVARNADRYAAAGISFQVLDLMTDELPEVDVILCRDCLVHLTEIEIRTALSNIAGSSSEYLLATTFPELERNRDGATGKWRPINLQAEPFNLPPPMELISEGVDGRYSDKSLGLWRVADILQPICMAPAGKG